MKTLQEIKTIVHANFPLLREKYKVKTIGIFGSFISNEQRKDSDIDILVEFDEPIDLLMFIELEDYLSEMLGIKVDLVMRDTLKPRIKNKILEKAVYL